MKRSILLWGVLVGVGSVAGMAAGSGCSGATVSVLPTDGGGDSTTDGESADAGGPDITDSATPDVADARTPKDSGPPFDAAGIQCGATRTCNSPDVCCATPTDGGVGGTCATSCDGGAGVVACDGPEDCLDGGAFCCASLTLGGTTPGCSLAAASASCADTCTTDIKFQPVCPNSDTARLCHAAADCANEPTGNTSCCTLALGTQKVTICMQSFLAAAAGATCM